jgi:hypothetical protein
MTAIKTMAVISQCINILHDQAAESPQAAAEILGALMSEATPAAYSVAHLVREVAEARHGRYAVSRAEGQCKK